MEGETRTGTRSSGSRLDAFKPSVIWLLGSDMTSNGSSERPGNYDSGNQGSVTHRSLGNLQGQGLMVGGSDP